MVLRVCVSSSWPLLRLGNAMLASRNRDMRSSLTPRGCLHLGWVVDLSCLSRRSHIAYAGSAQAWAPPLQQMLMDDGQFSAVDGSALPAGGNRLPSGDSRGGPGEREDFSKDPRFADQQLPQTTLLPLRTFTFLRLTQEMTSPAYQARQLRAAACASGICSHLSVGANAFKHRSECLGSAASGSYSIPCTPSEVCGICNYVADSTRTFLKARHHCS